MSSNDIPRPPWRRRVGFYLLLAAGALLLIHFLESRPRDLQLSFVLGALEVPDGDGRLDRDELVELSVEIRQDDKSFARSSRSFARGTAPVSTRPLALRLTDGDYEAQFRLVFETRAGERRLFALRRHFVVTDDGRPLTLALR